MPRDNWLLNYADENVLACYDHLWSDDALQSSFAAMWGHVAARLANEPAIIGFDPMNEPHWGTYAVSMFEVDRLQPFYGKAITATSLQPSCRALRQIVLASLALKVVGHLVGRRLADITIACRAR